MSKNEEIVAVEKPERLDTVPSRKFKEIIRGMKDIDEFNHSFVCYTPVVPFLLCNRKRSTYATDVISQSLSSIAGEHPLVITDVHSVLFDFAETILTMPEDEHFRRTLYVVSKECWNKQQEVWGDQTSCLICDPADFVFYVLSCSSFWIQNPFGKGGRIEVKAFQAFGNKGSWYFTSKTPPKLCCGYPVKEIVEIASCYFERFVPVRATADSCQELWVRGNETDKRTRLSNFVALQEKNHVHQILDHPLSESQLDAGQRADCYKLIRYYESLFGKGD